MKFLIDFFPVLLFFLVYKFYEKLPPSWIETANQIPYVSLSQSDPKHAILFATLCIIVATVVQNIVHFILHKRFEKMHLITLGILLVFGSLTVVLKDATFIIWKVSVINWLFAAAFLGSQFIGSKTLVERMMSQAMQVPRIIWRNANLMWVTFFVLIGILNLIVAYNFSEETWVDFKLFGMMGLTFVFIIAQVVYLQRHAITSEGDESDQEAKGQ